MLPLAAACALAAEDADAAPQPFEPVDVAINQFALNALGAKVTAEGALKAPEGGDIEARAPRPGGPRPGPARPGNNPFSRKQGMHTPTPGDIPRPHPMNRPSVNNGEGRRGGRPGQGGGQRGGKVVPVHLHGGDVL